MNRKVLHRFVSMGLIFLLFFPPVEVGAMDNDKQQVENKKGTSHETLKDSESKANMNQTSESENNNVESSTDLDNETDTELSNSQSEQDKENTPESQKGTEPEKQEDIDKESMDDQENLVPETTEDGENPSTETETTENQEENNTEPETTENQEDNNTEIESSNNQENIDQEQLEDDTDMTINEIQVQKTSQNEVIIDNIKYYLNSNQEVYYAEELKGTKIVKVYEFYTGASLENAKSKIKYIFELNDNKLIKTALKREENTGRNLIHYEYYPKTKYATNGQHSKHIQYTFSLDSKGYIKSAVKKENQTGRNLTYYEYYPNTKYAADGLHSKQIQYRFQVNTNGHLKSAVKKQAGTGKNIAHYEYYPKTKYGSHTKQIQYKFQVDTNGYLKSAVKNQQGTGKNIAHYEYYPKAKYGSHTKQIQYSFSINSKGYIKNAVKKEQNTGFNIVYYEYYPNTVYGKHTKQIQYQFLINQKGYITKAYKLEAGTGKRTKEYRYQSNTRYGSHSSRITQVINLNVPSSNIVNPNKVYSYNQMVNDIKALAKSYPNLITYHSIGKSEYGRDIYAVSIGKGKPTAFINGSHHAREWLTTNLNMYMIEQYAKAYYRNEKILGYDTKSILNGTTLWFVPMVNPDGVTLQQEGLKAFPKSIHSSLIKMNNGSQNFKRWKANAKGIDLNRQYDAGWSLINSPKSPSYQNYKGSKPVEAKETKAIVAFTNKIDPEAAVAYHSTGQILYWNYLQTGANYQRDLGMAKVISKLTGYSLFYPVGRPSGGGYTDWFIQAKKRPGFTPEIAKYVFESNPPLSEFTGAWNENKAVGLYVAQQSVQLNKKRK